MLGLRGACPVQLRAPWSYATRAILASLTVGGARGLCSAGGWPPSHLDKVNEVMLGSSGGDSGVQFVELLDRGGAEEQFHAGLCAPTSWWRTTAPATSWASRMLNPHRAFAERPEREREYLISTSGRGRRVRSKPADERLGRNAPLRCRGRACFESQHAEPQPPLSCLTWGACQQGRLPTNSMGHGIGQRSAATRNGQS